MISDLCCVYFQKVFMQIFIKVVFILYLFLGPFENLKISNLELGRWVGGGLEVSLGLEGVYHKNSYVILF